MIFVVAVTVGFGTIGADDQPPPPHPPPGPVAGGGVTTTTPTTRLTDAEVLLANPSFAKKVKLSVPIYPSAGV